MHVRVSERLHCPAVSSARRCIHLRLKKKKKKLDRDINPLKLVGMHHVSLAWKNKQRILFKQTLPSSTASKGQYYSINYQTKKPFQP
jgi:hypothetical protein